MDLMNDTSPMIMWGIHRLWVTSTSRGYRSSGTRYPLWEHQQSYFGHGRFGDWSSVYHFHRCSNGRRH